MGSSFSLRALTNKPLKWERRVLLESKLFQCETIIHVCDLPFELHVPLCFQLCPNAGTFKYMLLVSDVNNV